MSRKLPRLGRDWVLFVAGMAGIGHETLIAKSERPTLLFAFMAMVGLPAFLRADEKKSTEVKPPAEPKPPEPPEPEVVKRVRKRAPGARKL